VAVEDGTSVNWRTVVSSASPLPGKQMESAADLSVECLGCVGQGGRGRRVRYLPVGLTPEIVFVTSSLPRIYRVSLCCDMAWPSMPRNKENDRRT